MFANASVCASADAGTSRAVAIRFMSPLGRFAVGQWHPEMMTPEAADAYASSLAELGVRVRLYDVETDLDRGKVRVTPKPGWEPAAVAPPELEADNPNRAVVAGRVTLERSLSRWRVFVIDTESEFAIDDAGDTSEHSTREAAVAWLRSWAKNPIGCAAIAVGPGDGPVTIERLKLWAHAWAVWRANRTGPAIANTPWICRGKLARGVCKEIEQAGDCPVIVTPYQADHPAA